MKESSSNGPRNRGGWSTASLAYLEKVKEVLESLRDYWPLTLRQLYYQLVAALFIENTKGEYQKLSGLLAKGRLEGLIPWDAIEDRTRSLLRYATYRDKDEFLSSELENFLSGYQRDLLQSQPVAIEVWVEKDALSRLCLDVASQYCVPVVVARGFSSVSYVNSCRERVLKNFRQGKQTRILYFGDLDPSGWEMLPSMLTTLQEEMKLHGIVHGLRCALSPEQVTKHRLPKNPDALKETDPRAKKYRKLFGDLAVELDALPPAALQTAVKDSILAEIDPDLFKQELALWRAEAEEISAMKEDVEKKLRKRGTR